MHPRPLPSRALTWRSLAGLFLAVLIGLLSPPLSADRDDDDDDDDRSKESVNADWIEDLREGKNQSRRR